MASRAKPSGIHLTDQDAAIVKGMLARGDRQHDIAAWFGVNGGRIAEVATGKKFASVQSLSRANLPPAGPYPTGREATIALQALVTAKAAILSAEDLVKRYIH